MRKTPKNILFLERGPVQHYISYKEGSQEGSHEDK